MRNIVRTLRFTRIGSGPHEQWRYDYTDENEVRQGKIVHIHTKNPVPHKVFARGLKAAGFENLVVDGWTDLLDMAQGVGKFGVRLRDEDYEYLFGPKGIYPFISRSEVQRKAQEDEEAEERMQAELEARLEEERRAALPRARVPTRQIRDIAQEGREYVPEPIISQPARGAMKRTGAQPGQNIYKEPVPPEWDFPAIGEAFIPNTSRRVPLIAITPKLLRWVSKYPRFVDEVTFTQEVMRPGIIGSPQEIIGKVYFILKVPLRAESKLDLIKNAHIIHARVDGDLTEPLKIEAKPAEIKAEVEKMWPMRKTYEKDIRDVFFAVSESEANKINLDAVLDRVAKEERISDPDAVKILIEYRTRLHNLADKAVKKIIARKTQ